MAAAQRGIKRAIGIILILNHSKMQELVLRIAILGMLAGIETVFIPLREPIWLFGTLSFNGYMFIF